MAAMATTPGTNALPLSWVSGLLAVWLWPNKSSSTRPHEFDGGVHGSYVSPTGTHGFPPSSQDFSCEVFTSKVPGLRAIQS